MDDPPLIPPPPDENEELLIKKFYEHITSQSDLMDQVSGRLLTLELAIPGIYATVLKLAHGDKATVPLTEVFYFTFLCWFLALALTLCALIPRRWNVDPGLMRQAPELLDKAVGIEDFFALSARYKQRLIVASSVLFFTGVFCAALSIG